MPATRKSLRSARGTTELTTESKIDPTEEKKEEIEDTLMEEQRKSSDSEFEENIKETALTPAASRRSRKRVVPKKYRNDPSLLRRSSRKRKVLEDRDERENKRQKLEEEDLAFDAKHITEDEEELKKKSDELHKEWKFLVVIHFIEHFRDVLAIPRSITALGLESELVSCNPSRILRDLFIAILPHVRCSVSTSKKTWYRVLNIVLCRRCQCFEYNENPLKEIAEKDFFSETPLITKIAILQYLCEWALEESKKIQAELKEKADDSNFLRPLPLGWDKEGNSFWRFGECDLLYKQIEAEKSWKVVCKTPNEWKDLSTSFKHSSNKDEQELHSYLEEDLIPLIFERAEQERKKQKKQKKQNLHLLSSDNIISQDGPRRSTRIK